SQRLFFRLASRALLAPIGGSFASARPLYLTGFSPKTTDGLLSSSPNLVAFKPFSSRFSFSSSEVKGHERLPSRFEGPLRPLMKTLGVLEGPVKARQFMESLHGIRSLLKTLTRRRIE